MPLNGCVAMILAGGRGERLGALTRYYPKPAVYFGANHRIIDYTLSNCKDSGIDSIGILSQFFSGALHDYISYVCDYRPLQRGIYMLPSQETGKHYLGTADAVYKNIGFIERFNPENVLILSGDHIYKMDYSEMAEFHKRTNADVTIAAARVPISEASRFGIISADGSGCIFGFQEKPQFPQHNLASMGIYIFKWQILKSLLQCCSQNPYTDFGKNLLPAMLNKAMRMYVFEFRGYWRDVGTIDSLWEANMDQLNDPFMLNSDAFSQPYTKGMVNAQGSSVSRSILSPGCTIFGQVEHSVLGELVTVCKNAEIINSVVMPGAYIGENAKVYNSIIGTKAAIMENAVIGTDNGTDFFVDSALCARGVSLAAPWSFIEKGMRFKSNSHIDKEKLQDWQTYSKPHRISASLSL